MPNFEVFTKRGSSTSTEPTLTIHKTGSMALSKPAYELLGDTKYVELLWDDDEKIIGIRGAPEGTAHAYPLRHTESNPGQWLLSGLAFAKHYGLYSKQTRRFSAYMEDGVLCVDTKQQPVVIGGNNGSRRRQKEAAD